MSIHIKKENRGKFNATKKRTGKTTEELTHSKNPLTRKRAIFAQNAKKWKHDDGGYLYTDPPTLLDYLSHYRTPEGKEAYLEESRDWNKQLRKDLRDIKRWENIDKRDRELANTPWSVAGFGAELEPGYDPEYPVLIGEDKISTRATNELNENGNELFEDADGNLYTREFGNGGNFFPGGGPLGNMIGILQSVPGVKDILKYYNDKGINKYFNKQTGYYDLPQVTIESKRGTSPLAVYSLNYLYNKALADDPTLQNYTFNLDNNLRPYVEDIDAKGNKITRDYIGGTQKQTRDKYWEQAPVVAHAADSIANRYGISKDLLRHRLNHEGYTDTAIQEHNDLADTHSYKFLSNPTWVSGFGLFGLDDTGTFIQEGKVKPINENWIYKKANNEHDRELNSVSGETIKDNMGLMAGTLKYLRSRAEELHPEFNDQQLDWYTNMMYNRGQAGAKNYYKNNGFGDYKFDLGGNLINNNNMYNKFETGGTKRPQYDKEAWHDYLDTDHLSLNDEPEYYAGRIPETVITAPYVAPNDATYVAPYVQRPQDALRYVNFKPSQGRLDVNWYSGEGVSPYGYVYGPTYTTYPGVEEPVEVFGTDVFQDGKRRYLDPYEFNQLLHDNARTLDYQGIINHPGTYFRACGGNLYAPGGEMQMSPEEAAMIQQQGAEGMPPEMVGEMPAGAEQGMPVPQEGGMPTEMMGGQQQMSQEEMEEQQYEEERRQAFEEAREEAREEGKKTFEFEGRIYVTETGQLVNNEKACGGRLRGYGGNMFAYGGLDGPEPDAFNVGPTDPPYVEQNDATYVVPNNVNPYRTVYNDDAKINNTYLKRFGTNFIGGPDIYPYWNITGPHKDNNYTTSYFSGGTEPKKDVLTPYELDQLILDNIRQRNYNKFIRDFNNKHAEGGSLDYDIEEPYPYDEGYTPEQAYQQQQFNDLEAQRREAYNQQIKNRIKDRLLREYGITEDELNASRRREARKKKKFKK